MLTADKNELLCTVGPGSAMGDAIRRSWLPAALSRDLRKLTETRETLRILGENLVISHRDGGYLATREPAGEMKSYPAAEAGGYLWIYMGAPERQPPLPQFEWLNLPAAHVLRQRILVRANYLQALEGTVDSSHAAILHFDGMRPTSSGDPAADPRSPSSRTLSVRPSADRKPALKVADTDYGFEYVALYSMGGTQGSAWARVTRFVFPVFCYVPAPSVEGTSIYHVCNAFVPIDDHHTWINMIQYSRDTPISAERRAELDEHFGFRMNIEIDENYHLIDRDPENNWRQDRDRMRDGSSFAGVDGVIVQDVVVAEAQGPILDRSAEHLGAQDIAVSRLRHVMLAVATSISHGLEPSWDPRTIRYEQIHPAVGILPTGTHWQDL